jgi:hypothetical protein
MGSCFSQREQARWGSSSPNIRAVCKYYTWNGHEPIVTCKSPTSLCAYPPHLNYRYLWMTSIFTPYACSSEITLSIFAVSVLGGWISYHRCTSSLTKRRSFIMLSVPQHSLTLLGNQRDQIFQSEQCPTTAAHWILLNLLYTISWQQLVMLWWLQSC